MNIALIVAGGSGLRMKKKIRKQYLDLVGRPIIAHTISAFGQCRQIDGIILALPAEDIDMVAKTILPPLNVTIPVNLVEGGTERQDSVYNGLKSLPSECRIVLIHDGVRPFVKPDHISACIKGAQGCGASILGVPALDTLKRVGEDGKILGTLERQQIWMAQTPQAFRVDLIRTAHQRAREDGIVGTDDATLIERLGLPVKVIPGSRTNIKITTEEDLQLALALLLNQRGVSQ